MPRTERLRDVLEMAVLPLFMGHDWRCGGQDQHRIVPDAIGTAREEVERLPVGSDRYEIRLCVSKPCTVDHPRIVFLVCFCLTCLGTLIFQCTPISAAWDFSIRAKPSTDCFSNDTFTAIGLFNSIINCITDFLLAVVPIPLILKLQVNTRTKLSLAFILSLGYFACAAGIVKAIKQHNFFQEKDPLWSNSFNVWNMIELCVGIIAASLPALRPLFAKILESSKHAFSGSWPGSKGSKNRTIGSSGHRKRKSEEIDFLVGKEFQLNAMGGSQRSANLEIGENSVTPPSRPGSPTDRMYTVAITGGNKPPRTSAGSGESYEGLVPGRNGSKEPLARPDAIYKKTEVVSLTSSRSR